MWYFDTRHSYIAFRCHNKSSKKIQDWDIHSYNLLNIYKHWMSMSNRLKLSKKFIYTDVMWDTLYIEADDGDLWGLEGEKRLMQYMYDYSKKNNKYKRDECSQYMEVDAYHDVALLHLHRPRFTLPVHIFLQIHHHHIQLLNPPLFLTWRHEDLSTMTFIFSFVRQPTMTALKKYWRIF